ncbi:hypothetical protein KSP39_PZI017100 [Platanthera zijinensis]|uniref:F-box domain-containing protein n=1 Tax=Platanthera zijinensis TaxID=2320716 RepID=A0AAP0B6A6_9ASPA
MDGVVCDELLQEIIQRLPPSSFAAVSLVSKRWLSALRSSTTSLSLAIPFSAHPLQSSSLSSILSHYPHLHSLSIHSSPFDADDGESYPPSPPPKTPTSISSVSLSSDALLLAVASSPSSSRLNQLRFATAAIPVSPAALLSSSSSLTRLTDLHLSSVFPYSFRWLAGFPFIKSLSLVFCPKSPAALGPIDEEIRVSIEEHETRPMKMLPLERLSLSGLPAGERAMWWIWRRCGNLRRLRFRACEGTGDGPSSPFFPSCLPGLLELELRSSRAIADRVLLHAADRCHRLNSFLLHDGGGSEALHHFIAQRAAGLHTIDLRLPLDLHNYHLSAIAASPSTHSPCLSTLRLQSCCLVTGDGLRSVASAAAGKAIEELALVNCDVVERDPGLLCVLGQSLPRLRKLDLSFNETMTDKELVAMLSSFSGLVEIKLQGCGKLTDASLVWLLAFSSSKLEVADLRRCPGISSAAIETFVLMSFRLKLLCVEKKKMSEAAMAAASRRGIWIGD